ncbi:cytochrome o ubiquinol oxidase subunit IV [Arsenophonus symbiont of Ornithomya chloropus]|uniref:cytochrome o ubiquinol oxidase subunit IV n=1 Tax=Arsenophonus symbiont of Ornithomya chloropus TaxID=634121 RepID=UPI0032B281C9
MNNISFIECLKGKQSSIKTYLIGFILSIILTIIPFLMVINNTTSHNNIVLTIIITGISQILIHLIYFLHIHTTSNNNWNIISLLFTILVIIIIVTGSIWIMYNLNINMLLD